MCLSQNYPKGEHLKQVLSCKYFFKEVIPGSKSKGLGSETKKEENLHVYKILLISLEATHTRIS